MLVTAGDAIPVDRDWSPAIGDRVWFNHPDQPDPAGVVKGFAEDGLRKGQPIIERDAGDRFVTHRMFLLPFVFGGKEWAKADAEGRIR